MTDDKIQQLRRILFECYDHMEKRCCHGVEGKGGDGRVTVIYPSWVEERNPWTNDDKKTCIEIYSYVFCDGRRDYFTDIDEAIAHVQKWHDEEFAQSACNCITCEIAKDEVANG